MIIGITTQSLYLIVYTNYVWSCKSVHELAMAFQCINIKMHTHQFTKYHELNSLSMTYFWKRREKNNK